MRIETDHKNHIEAYYVKIQLKTKEQYHTERTKDKRLALYLM